MADQKPERDWRKEAARASSDAERGSKAPALFVAGGLALTLVTVLLYWVFSLKTAPPARLLYLAFAGNPRWPVVPFANADYERLKPLFVVPEHSGYKRSEFVSAAEESKRYGAMLEDLQSAVPDQPLVMYVKSLAVVREGKVYLVTANASPAEKDDDWRPVTDLISAFGKCPAKHRLLVLDVAYPVAGPLTGVFSDRAASLLQSTVEGMKADLNGGWVLITAGPGEFAQPLDDESVSAVACYLDRGLRGKADDGDRKLHVRELADYVAERTRVWTKHGLGVYQKPHLIGSGDDFQIVVDARAESTKKSEAGEYPLKALWGKRDQWATPGAAQGPGSCMRRALELELMRADERLDAGEPAQTVVDDTTGKISALVEAWKLLDKPPPQSLQLPPLTWLGRDKPEVDVNRAKGVVADWLTGSSELKKPKMPDDGKDEHLYLSGIWGHIGQFPISFEKAQRLFTTEALPSRVVRGDYAESLLLAELMYLTTAKGNGDQPIFKKQREASWPDKGIAAAVIAEQRYRQALSELTPETYLWFEKELDEVQKLMLAAERTLLRTADPKETLPIDRAKESQQQYKAAWDACREVSEKATAARAALKVLNRAYDELPGYAPLLARLDGNLRGEPLLKWREAVVAADQLATAFAATQFPGQDAFAAAEIVSNRLGYLDDWLEKQVAPWRIAYPTLTAPKKKESEGESAPPIVNPPRHDGDAVPVKQLADCPRVKAADREICWQWSRRLSAQAWRTLSEDRADPNTENASLHPRAKDVGAQGLVVQDEAKQAEARAQIGVEMLRLAGRLTSRAIEQRLNELGAERSQDLEAWDKLAVEIYKAAYPRQQAKSSGGEAPKDEVAAARASRVLGDSVAGARYAGTLRKAYCNWLHEYVQREAAGRKLALGEAAPPALLSEFAVYYNNLAVIAQKAAEAHDALGKVRDP